MLSAVTSWIIAPSFEERAEIQWTGIQLVSCDTPTGKNLNNKKTRPPFFAVNPLGFSAGQQANRWVAVHDAKLDLRPKALYVDKNFPFVELGEPQKSAINWLLFHKTSPLLGLSIEPFGCLKVALC